MRATDTLSTVAGYSGTPLFKKMGIREESRVWLVGAPRGFETLLAGMPPGASVSRRLRKDLDIVVCFATEASDLFTKVETARAALPPDGSIWMAWPKKASKVPTDITEDRLREMFLPTGLVDIKVCAIDEVWSGLKFVVRKELR